MAVQGPQLPLDHPLAGCEAKLRRAQQNLALLDNEIGRYLDRHPEPIPRVGEFDRETNEHIRWRFRPIEHPDPILGAVVGDYVHDLRSTLDHLAFELSFLDTSGKIPPRTIAFPCCRVRNPVKNGPPAWNSKTTRAKLAGINARHRAMIYTAQPCYRRKDTPLSPRTGARRRRNALADLEDFWNHDKHRTLEPVASKARRLWGLPRGGWIEDVPIRMKTTIVRKDPGGTWTQL